MHSDLQPILNQCFFINFSHTSCLSFHFELHRAAAVGQNEVELLKKTMGWLKPNKFHCTYSINIEKNGYIIIYIANQTFS